MNFENILFFHKKVFKNFLFFFVMRYLLQIIPTNIILISFIDANIIYHYAIYCARERKIERDTYVHLFIFCLTLTYQIVFVYTVLLGSARSSSLLYFDG